MTDNPFAALLNGVPRYDETTGWRHPEGIAVRINDVLAALAAAYPADLAEAGKVLERLRWNREHPVTGKLVYANEDGPDAADLITALLARIAAQEAQIKGLEKDRDRRTEMHECAMSERDDATLYADEQKARAEAAETALAAMTKERDGLLTTWAESRERHLTAETALAAEREKVARLVEAGPPFFFDRYINGVRMAEDVCVERETTLEGAMRVAARIAAKGPNGEPPVLVYRSTETAARAAIREAGQ